MDDTQTVTFFDFESHKNNAIDWYRKIRPIYEAYCYTLKSIVENCLRASHIKFQTIEARAKDIERFWEKSAERLDENPETPKYKNPLTEIKDLAGVRIITYFPSTIDDVDKIIYNEFDVIEKNNKNDLLEEEEKMGYKSVHYLVKLKNTRTHHPEYASFENLIAEIQVRTILQHAWAEIEHDIEYKSTITIPKNIKRRFMSLAGLLEIADREFQSIQNENEDLKKQSRESVNMGKLDKVEITGDSLRAYLDKKYGPDGRMSEWSYQYTAGNLIKMGFESLKQIDECVQEYDDDKISRILWWSRPGQLSRLENVILAALGDDYLNRHPWCTTNPSESDTWKGIFKRKIDRLEKEGIQTGKYNLKKSGEVI